LPYTLTPVRHKRHMQFLISAPNSPTPRSWPSGYGPDQNGVTFTTCICVCEKHGNRLAWQVQRAVRRFSASVDAEADVGRSSAAGDRVQRQCKSPVSLQGIELLYTYRVA